MQRRVLNALILSLIVACGPAGPGDVEGPQGEGDEDLVEAAEPWEGEPLEPVLIGELPDKNDDPIREPGKQKDAGLYVIVDTPYQIWTGAGTYIHVGAWDENWEPAAGARIFVDDDEVGKTNKHGTLVFQYVPNKSDSYADHNLWAVLDRGGKRHVGSVYFAANRRTESFESANLFVYTDRGVFNPGQTIHVRALAWTLRGEFTPLANKEVEILLKNDRNRVVGGGSTETDEWGILSHDIPLPKHAPEGNYTLQANFERESAEAKIRIERFVPPVIEIRHDLGRFLTRDQETLPFEVNLGYFGGGTFESGKVKVTVKAQGKQLFKETRDVTGEGPFAFELSKEDLGKIRSGLYENDKVQVIIKVTDKFGRSDEVKRDLRYVVNPYVAVIIADKESYGEGDPVLVSVRIKDLDHVPIRGKEVKCVIGGETFKEKTDDDGVAEFRTKMGNTTLSVEAYMEGVTAAVAYSSLYFRYTPPMLSEIPGGKVGEREMTEIVVRFPGEYLPAEEVIHADVTDSSGSIVYGFEIPIKKESGKYVGRTEFPGPSWGSMLITLYCIARPKEGKEVGLLADGQKLEVAPRKTIEIELKDVPKTARPGEKLKFSATFKNAQGKKIAPAVGASLVDDAVLSLLDPLEITPMDRFYNPELKVLSTTGATTLTWPVVSRNWGGALHDIAWCNWGWRTGGPMVGGGGYGGGPMGGGGMGGGYGDMSAGADYYMDEMMEAEEDSGGAPYAMQAPAEPMSSPAPPPATTMPMKKAKMSSKSEASYDFDDSSIEGEFMKPTGDVAGPSKPKPDVNITIRTDFAETSLWAPHLVADEKGKLEIETKLPDSITVQKLTLVASDKVGGSGIKHHEIKVEQDLYARSDLPAALTLGDKIEVQAALRNLTKKTVSATLELESSVLKVVGSSKVKVKAEAGGTAVARFTVQPAAAGDATYMVTATGKGFKDIEERRIHVRPSGVPHVIERKGTLSSSKPFKEEITFTGSEDYKTGFIHVAFPTAVPALQGLDAVMGKPQGCIDWVSSSSLIAASVYQYMQKYGKDEKALQQMGQVLQLGLAGLLMSQRDDGGWGWNVNLLRVDDTGKETVQKVQTNPYMTAQSLEGLLEMKAAGLPVPQDAVTRALDSLVSSMDSDNLWDMSSIAIWEGKSERVKVGMSAEIFKLMAYAKVVYPEAANMSSGYSQAMGKLRPIFEAYLDDESADVFTMANAALGLLRMKQAQGGSDKKLDKKLEATAKKLLLMRKESHWEPGWFNAWGGNIEATQAAMELMALYDAEAFELELRESLRYILSTQTSFGDWHNAKGTASAIKALLLLPPTVEEKASTVHISVNGTEVRTIEINPDDPFLSAVTLRMVEITEHFQKGKNTVKVTYDGNLKAPVSLMVEKWTGKDADPLSDAPRVTLTRSYDSDTLSPDQPTTVNLKMAVSGRMEPLVITEPLPANASIETASLDRLVQDRIISDYILLPGAIELYVAPTKKIVDLTYRLTGDRNGKAVQAPTQVTLLRLPHSPAYGQETTLTVK